MAVTASHRAGFTLVEVLVSLVVIGVALAAALQTLGACVRLNRSQTARDVALALAHDLVSEIAQARYTDPEAEAAGEAATFGLEADEIGGVGRTTFDDLDDYDGWTVSPPESRSGAAIPGAEGLTRSASVEYVDLDDPGGPALPNDTGLRRITVTVRGPTGTASVAILRGRYTSTDQQPTVTGSFVRQVSATIRLGAHGQDVTTGATVLNQVPLEDAP